MSLVEILYAVSDEVHKIEKLFFHRFKSQMKAMFFAKQERWSLEKLSMDDLLFADRWVVADTRYVFSSFSRPETWHFTSNHMCVMLLSISQLCNINTCNLNEALRLIAEDLQTCLSTGVKQEWQNIQINATWETKFHVQKI